ncbi:hypothetical protein LCGC14_1936070, partial [marine sediment metagenome]
NKLDYPADWYNNTGEGSIVTKSGLLHCNTNSDSVDLARALGVTLWDFNIHQLKIENINWAALHALFENGFCYEEENKEIENLRALLTNGFICLFQPNG